jgi:hypothetical protein
MNDAKTSKAFADLEKAEVRMVRAINRWTKARAKVKRMDAKYAKRLAETLPGKMDVRQMPIKPKPWPKGSNRVIKVKLKPLTSR